jgi:FtsZ-binding cell division protein ZapB
MKRTRILCGALLVVAIGACVTAPAPRPVVVDEIPADTPAPAVSTEPAVAAPTEGRKPPEPQVSEVDQLLIDFERLRKLPAGDLAREQEIARQVFTQSKTDLTRVKWAMALSLPGATAADETRALELLEPLLKNFASPLRGLAFLLTASIQEQRRLSALAQGLQQNMQTLQQSNQTLQQNLIGFQQKLDALRTLERSLTERGEAAAPRKK